MLNAHYLRQVNIICKFKQKYQCVSLPAAGVHWSISETPTQHSICSGLGNSVTHLPMFMVCFTIGVDVVLTGKSSIAFGLLLGWSFFNKLHMKVSAVSKCNELRIISEALSSQVWSLTWRHPSYHDVDAQEAQTLGGQHKYLPVEAYIGWDGAYDTCWWHNPLCFFESTIKLWSQFCHFQLIIWFMAMRRHSWWETDTVLADLASDFIWW